MTKQDIDLLTRKLHQKIEGIEFNGDKYVDAVELPPALWKAFIKHAAVTSFQPAMSDGCVGSMYFPGCSTIAVFENDSLVGTNVILIVEDL